MLKFVIVLSVLAAATAATIPNAAVNVVSSDQLKDLLIKYPNAKKLNVSYSPDINSIIQPQSVIFYTFGERQNGDSLASGDFGYNSWMTKRDASITVTYPSTGLGNVITYFKIMVSQSTKNGGAYLIAGGPGDRFFTVVIEAINTFHLNYDLVVYTF